MRIAAQLAFLGLLAGVVPASADTAPTPLVVQTDQSMMIMLSADPNTVVVGNPSIADISLNGRQLFVHGHAFGETNIMILDGSGNTVANYYVNVMHTTQNQLTVFAANSASVGTIDRRTYTCAPICEGNPMPGDTGNFFGTITGQSTTRYGNATGIKSSDTKAPSGQPPQ